MRLKNVHLLVASFLLPLQPYFNGAIASRACAQTAKQSRHRHELQNGNAMQLRLSFQLGVMQDTECDGNGLSKSWYVYKWSLELIYGSQSCILVIAI